MSPDRTDGGDLRLQLANRLPEIHRVAKAVDAFCRDKGLPAKDAHDFTLILDEVITNIISYALDKTRDHTITVDLALTDGRLVAEVTDPGIPFDPLQVPEPDLDADLEDRPIGGLGIHFLRTLMDEAHYRRDGSLNRLRFGRRTR